MFHHDISADPTNPRKVRIIINKNRNKMKSKEKIKKKKVRNLPVLDNASLIVYSVLLLICGWMAVETWQIKQDFNEVKAQLRVLEEESGKQSYFLYMLYQYLSGGSNDSGIFMNTENDENEI